MANQSNPFKYAFVVRCPLEDGASLRTLAKEAGQTVSAYVASLIKKRIGKRELSDSEHAWVAARLKVNCHRRAKADAKTAAGYYRGKQRQGRNVSAV